jgi:glycosyltransferase involved in cell wall biosynthesis
VPDLAVRAGGPPRGVLGLARALQSLGHEATVYTTNIDGRQPLFTLRPRVIDVPTDRSVLVDGVEVRHFQTVFPSRWGTSPALARELRRQIGGFDLVHIHSLYRFSTFAAARTAHGAGVPYIVLPHGALDPYLRRQGPLKRTVYEALIERWNLDHAAVIHYTAEDEMRLVSPMGLKAPGVVAPVGVELAEFDILPPRGTFRRRYRLEDRDIVLFLGRLTVKKGLDLLAEAFIEIAPRFPRAHLVIVGPEESRFGAAMRARLHTCGVGDRVTFTGLVSDPDRLAALAAADLWVLPSYTENFCTAMVEAMACRLPVVISDRVNTWREVANADAGLVVPCETQPLADAIARLLADPALRRQMGERGRALAERHFTWSRAVQRMVEIYEDVVQRCPADRSSRHD